MNQEVQAILSDHVRVVRKARTFLSGLENFEAEIKEWCWKLDSRASKYRKKSACKCSKHFKREQRRISYAEREAMIFFCFCHLARKGVRCVDQLAQRLAHRAEPLFNACVPDRPHFGGLTVDNA